VSPLVAADWRTIYTITTALMQIQAAAEFLRDALERGREVELA
jgi:hypothetical protein